MVQIVTFNHLPEMAKEELLDQHVIYNNKIKLTPEASTAPVASLKAVS